MIVRKGDLGVLLECTTDEALKIVKLLFECNAEIKEGGEDKK